MLDIRIAIYQFKEPNTFIIDEKTGRLHGILGYYYQSFYDQLKWNVTYIEKTIIKKEGNFSSNNYDNDDVFFKSAIDKDYADFYFRQIQIDDVLDKNNIRLSPVVSAQSTRMLQCIHRKDDFNNRDILIGLNELDFSFWMKLFFVFLLLSFLLTLIYYVKQYYRFYYVHKIKFYKKLNMLIMFLFLFHMRLITRQSSNRKLYENLNFIRYLILIVIIFVTIVLNQLLFYAAFQNLKFRNTSYILRDLDQVLKDPELVPCFLESETVVNSKIIDKNSINYKLYKHQKDVCFLNQVMNNSKNKNQYQNNQNAISRLLTNVLVGSDEYVEFFGYLFCSSYNDFIRSVLSQTLKKTLEKELPLFWKPIFISEEIKQAFFINKKSSKKIQNEIYFKFVYWTFEHGWINFLKYIKYKIDADSSDYCFTSDLHRVLHPYRFSELLLANFSIIIIFTFVLYFISICFYLITWFYILFNQHIQIIWIKT